MKAPPRWRHPVVGRSAWTVADQAASSASNFVLAISVLAVADRRQFAAFSLVVTGYLLVTQLARSAFSLAVLVLYSGDPGAGDRSGPAAAAAVATGVLGALAFVAAGLTFGESRALFWVTAAALPFLQYQDVVRHVAVAAGVPRTAALSDILWVAGQLALTAVVAGTGRATPTTLLLVWAVTGSVSGVLWGTRLGLAPSPSRTWSWVKDNRRLCSRLTSELLLNSGSYYALSYGLVVVAGADQLGRWRAAQTLIGPVSVVLLGGATLALPESVRVRDRAGRLWRFAIGLSIVLGAVALAGGALAYVLLPEVGPELFPTTWETARPVLPVLTLFAVAVASSTGAVAALRARDRVGWLVRARAASGGVGLTLGLALAVSSGATGALAGLAVAELGFAVATWREVRRTLARPMPLT